MRTIFLTLLILQLISCHTLEDYQSNVNIVRKQDSFTYSFSGQGFSKKIEDCQTEAEKNIFEVVLFRGISGTDLQIPLVENEQVSKQQHSEFYRDFFDKKMYRNYISSQVLVVNNPRPTKGGYTCSVELTINLNSLKTNLEQNGIIRKFGL